MPIARKNELTDNLKHDIIKEKTMAISIVQDRHIRGQSSNWANWMSILSLTTCSFCTKQHGKIVKITILNNKYEIAVHPNCKCIYVPMRTKKIGTATNMGNNGVDAHLMIYKKLPNYYISKDDAEDAGWVDWRGNLDKVLPGKMIGGDLYKNRDGKLPSSPGRVWHEADIDYSGGYRNKYRILYSNDGLIFVSYDHYKTFYEITKR